MHTTEPPLTITQDPRRDCVTIEGVRYSAGLFRDLAILPNGTWTQVVNRRDGTLTLRSVTANISRLFDELLAQEGSR